MGTKGGKERRLHSTRKSRNIYETAVAKLTMEQNSMFIDARLLGWHIRPGKAQTWR